VGDKHTAAISQPFKAQCWLLVEHTFLKPVMRASMLDDHSFVLVPHSYARLSVVEQQYVSGGTAACQADKVSGGTAGGMLATYKRPYCSGCSVRMPSANHHGD